MYRMNFFCVVLEMFWWIFCVVEFVLFGDVCLIVIVVVIFFFENV